PRCKADRERDRAERDVASVGHTVYSNAVGHHRETSEGPCRPVLRQPRAPVLTFSAWLLDFSTLLRGAAIAPFQIFRAVLRDFTQGDTQCLLPLPKPGRT